MDKDTIHSLIEAQVEMRPDSIAVVFGDQCISYREFNEKANRLAHHLQEMGLLPDTPVALCMDRTLDLLIAMLGVLKAGGAYVPLDPSHPQERLLFILQDNQSPILLTTSNHKEKFRDYQGACIYINEALTDTNHYPAHNPSGVIKDEHLAYIIYTSGSTGVPKGVLIEHRSVINYCQWFASYSHVLPEQRIDFSSNYIFDMAVTTSIVPLMLGLTIVICDDKTKKNTRRYLNFIESNQINIIKLTPSYLKVLAQSAKNSGASLPDLQTLILGGENLNTADCKSWLKIYPNHVLYNEYGPTESTVGVSMYEVNHKNLHQLSATVPIGIPDTNVNFYILNQDKTLVADGETGELYIGGICLARGYLNQPALTAQKFMNLPLQGLETSRLYQTGDLCRQLQDGVLEYLGRIDQQVKIHGFRIELEEIERCLASHPAIKEVVVLAQEKEPHEKQLVAYYIPHQVNTIPETSQFYHYLNERLPPYMIPRAFVWVDSFPRTANDKLDRAALPVPKFSSGQHYVAPRSGLEKKIAAIWSVALGVKPIGVKDDFFELGGHSLTAARIVSEVESLLGKEISLDDFYHAPTIRKLCAVIKLSKDLDSQKNRPLITKKQPIIPTLNDFQFMLWIGHLIEPKIKKINIVGRRRLKGRLDMTTLNAAFESVFKKHEILLYRTRKFSPVQFLQKGLKVKVHETTLDALSKDDCELALLSSYDNLINHNPWPNNEPYIVAELFYLPDNLSELQIAMPHVISDFASIDVLFDSLSNFYLLHQCQVDTVDFFSQATFKSHLARERYDARAHLNKDMHFWKNYLKDAHFFYFPPDYIVKDMDAEGYQYSTYLEIPEQGLVQLQQYCAEKRLSLTDGLCATLGLALGQHSSSHQGKTRKIFISLIKTIRDKPIYDDKIGCFLRLDAIKIDINDHQDLETISKKIHQSTIDTMAHQRFPGLAKLACVNDLNWKVNALTNYFLTGCIYIYTKLFRSVHHKLFSLYLRLISFGKTNSFLIYINVLTNFLPNSLDKKESTMCGLEVVSPKLYKCDLSKINHVLEVCFLRDESKNRPYLVISGNIKPKIREQIGKEMLRIIQHETLRRKKAEHETTPVLGC